ncbi:reverse transcriptase domain-containing protein [Tanacetum coccineum]
MGTPSALDFHALSNLVPGFVCFALFLSIYAVKEPEGGCAKQVSFGFNHPTKEILVEVLNTKSVDTQEVNTIVEEEVENWMTPIIKCLEEGIWPTDENEARALRMKINQYIIEEGVLFKKSYLSPMLRCVGPLQANYIIREVHERACEMHAGARFVVAKIMRQGYYWPTMHQDTKEVVDRCDSFQIHDLVPRLPKTQLTSIMSAWLFYQWGLDILGPLPEGPDKLKFIIVVIDYFTKWMEAKPLAKTTIGKRPIQELVCKMEDQADEHGCGTLVSQWTCRKGKQVSDAHPQGKARPREGMMGR